MSSQKTKKWKTINVCPYTINGNAWYSDCDKGTFEVKIDFQAIVDVDEDEFAQALKDKKSGKKYRGRVIETPSDLAICKVEEFFDGHGIYYDDVSVTKCERGETKKRVKDEDD